MTKTEFDVRMKKFNELPQEAIDMVYEARERGMDLAAVLREMIAWKRAGKDPESREAMEHFYRVGFGREAKYPLP